MNIAIMAILAICFASCEKEQSSFEIADIKTTANIRGTILQNLGQDFQDGKYIENIVPAANKKVYVEINNSELAPNNQNGVTIYETTTNANGEYNINIPVLYNGTSVTVKAEQFIGTYKEVIDVDDNKPVFNDIDGVYAINNDTLTLYPEDIKFNDAIYVIDSRNTNEICKYNSTFIVKVGAPKYSIDKQKIDGEEKEFISLKYTTTSDINVIATINGICYGATTNSKGEAKFIIPSMEKEWTAEILIDTNPYIVNNFNFIKTEYTEKEVIKENEYGILYYDKEYVTEFKTYKIESGIMSFFAQDANEIHFSGIADDKAPVVKVALGFDAHTDIDTYEYDKNEWNSVELNF